MRDVVDRVRPLVVARNPAALPGESKLVAVCALPAASYLRGRFLAEGGAGGDDHASHRGRRFVERAKEAHESVSVALVGGAGAAAGVGTTTPEHEEDHRLPSEIVVDGWTTRVWELEAFVTHVSRGLPAAALLLSSGDEALLHRTPTWEAVARDLRGSRSAGGNECWRLPLKAAVGRQVNATLKRAQRVSRGGDCSESDAALVAGQVAACVALCHAAHDVLHGERGAITDATAASGSQHSGMAARVEAPRTASEARALLEATMGRCASTHSKAATMRAAAAGHSVAASAQSLLAARGADAAVADARDASPDPPLSDEVRELLHDLGFYDATAGAIPVLVVQCGSALYDLALPSSDRDYFIVFVQRTRDLLLGGAAAPCRDFVQLKSRSGADAEGTARELGRYLRELRKGHPKLVEPLFAAPERLAYAGRVWLDLATRRRDFLTERVRTTYLHEVNKRLRDLREGLSGKGTAKLAYHVLHRLGEAERLGRGEAPRVSVTGAERDRIMRVRTQPLAGDLSPAALLAEVKQRVLMLQWSIALARGDAAGAPAGLMGDDSEVFLAGSLAEAPTPAAPLPLDVPLSSLWPWLWSVRQSF